MSNSREKMSLEEVRKIFSELCPSNWREDESETDCLTPEAAADLNTLARERIADGYVSRVVWNKEHPLDNVVFIRFSKPLTLAR